MTDSVIKIIVSENPIHLYTPTTAFNVRNPIKKIQFSVTIVLHNTSE